MEDYRPLFNTAFAKAGFLAVTGQPKCLVTSHMETGIGAYINARRGEFMVQVGTHYKTLPDDTDANILAGTLLMLLKEYQDER